MSLVATTFDDFKSFENSLFVDFVGFESEVQLGLALVYPLYTIIIQHFDLK